MFLLQSLLIIVLLSEGAFCEQCVTFEFQKEEFFELFDSEGALCEGMPGSWRLDFYSNTSVPRPHEQSTSFISPSSSLSCVSSFTFPMKANGKFEVNLYLDKISIEDQLTIIIFQKHSQFVVGVLYVSLNSPEIVKGWNTLTVLLMGMGSYNGYVSFMGMAAENTTIFVDSFRYIPPSFEGECIIYVDNVAETESEEVAEPTVPGEELATEEYTDLEEESYPGSSEEKIETEQDSNSNEEIEPGDIKPEENGSAAVETDPEDEIGEELKPNPDDKKESEEDADSEIPENGADLESTDEETDSKDETVPEVEIDQEHEPVSEEETESDEQLSPENESESDEKTDLECETQQEPEIKITVGVEIFLKKLCSSCAYKVEDKHLV